MRSHALRVPLQKIRHGPCTGLGLKAEGGRKRQIWYPFFSLGSTESQCVMQKLRQPKEAHLWVQRRMLLQLLVKKNILCSNYVLQGRETHRKRSSHLRRAHFPATEGMLLHGRSRSI